MRISFICWLFFILSHLGFGKYANAQDTLFVKSLHLKGKVHNICTDGEWLFIRIGDSIYRRDNEEIIYVTRGHSKYSWISNDEKDGKVYWSHNPILLKQQQVPQSKVENILPGPYNANITMVQLKNVLYVCYNGVVLEYRINNLVKMAYKGRSVRHIYSEDGLRIISTYSGVFGEVFEDFFSFSSTKLENYSNGEFVRIGNQYFLCQDALLSYKKDSNILELFMMFQNGQDIRQIIEFNGVIVGVFTNGIFTIDLEKKAITSTIISDTLSNAAIIGNELICVNKAGTIYRVSKEYNVEKIQTDYNFNDIELISNTIFLGGDYGLYTLNNNSVSVVANFEVMEMINYNDQLIFSNNNGLYTWLDSKIEPIYTGVEFNRFALAYDKALFYAGSVNGLYFISVHDLDAWLNYKITNQQVKSVGKIFNFNYVIIIGVLLFLLGIILWKNHKIKKSVIQKRLIKPQFSESLLKEMIKKDKNILSVTDLADAVGLSTVHLNRKLSKSNTTALEIMKEAKKELALQLYERGVSIDNISKRVGYSKRYIKEYFLK